MSVTEAQIKAARSAWYREWNVEEPVEPDIADVDTEAWRAALEAADRERERAFTEAGMLVERAADVAQWRQNLVTVWNFPGHPGGRDRGLAGAQQVQDRHGSTAASHYRQGWIDAIETLRSELVSGPTIEQSSTVEQGPKPLGITSIDGIPVRTFAACVRDV